MALKHADHSHIKDGRMTDYERNIAVDVVFESLKPHGYFVYAWEPYIKLVDSHGMIVQEDVADKILREGAKQYWRDAAGVEKV